MKKYSLKNVEKVYSFLGKSPFMYKIASFVTFFGKENFLRRKAIENLNLKQGDKVLDLACGMGYNFEFLLNYTGDKGLVIGIDYVEEMLNKAKKEVNRKRWDNITLIKEDAAKINFPRNYFDGVISTIGMSSIPNHKEALKRAIKSLKDGKRIVILDGKLFDDTYKDFNPVIRCLRWSASWDKNKDIISDVKTLLRNVKIEKFFGGSVYIITGIKD